MIATRAILLGLLLALGPPLAAGCAGDFPEKKRESEHFNYRHRAEDPPCAELLPALEAHYGALRDYLGVSLPAGTRVRYYKFESSADFNRHGPCPPGSGGCVGTVDGQLSIFSQTGLHRHELIHAYLFEEGRPPALFEEGIAEVLSCAHYPSFPLSEEVAADAPLEQILESDAFRDVDAIGASHYPIAASFVRYLLDRFGLDQFLALYRLLAHDATSSETHAGFASVYGVSLVEVIAGWRATLPHFRWKASLCPATCAEPGPTLNPGEPLAIDSGGRCTDTRVAFSVPAQTDLEIRLTGVAPFAIFPCSAGTGEAAILEDWGPFEGLGWVQLTPGRYFAKLLAVFPYHARLEARPSVIAPRCAEATVQRVPDGIEELLIVASLDQATDDHPHPDLPGAPDHAVRLQFESPRTLAHVPAYDPVAVTLCEAGCPRDPSAICAPFPTSEVRSLNPNETYALILDGEPHLFGFYRLDLQLE